MTSSHSKVFVVLALSSLVILSSCSSKKTMKTSLADIVKEGRNYSCNFTKDDGKGTMTTGTMYIEGQGKNVRGDFTVTKAEKTSESHLIRTGDTMYIWTSVMPKGMKMTLSAEDTSLFGKNADPNMGMSDTEPMDFSCEGWSVDDDVFTPPSDVTFSDMTEQMKAVQNMMKSGSPAMGKNCSICDRITGDTAKAQCKQAMGC
jgi:hypothetical protein